MSGHTTPHLFGSDRDSTLVASSTPSQLVHSNTNQNNSISTFNGSIQSSHSDGPDSSHITLPQHTGYTSSSQHDNVSLLSVSHNPSHSTMDSTISLPSAPPSWNNAPQHQQHHHQSYDTPTTISSSSSASSHSILADPIVHNNAQHIHYSNTSTTANSSNNGSPTLHDNKNTITGIINVPVRHSPTSRSSLGPADSLLPLPHVTNIPSMPYQPTMSSLSSTGSFGTTGLLSGANAHHMVPPQQLQQQQYGAPHDLTTPLQSMSLTSTADAQGGYYSTPQQLQQPVATFHPGHHQPQQQQSGVTTRRRAMKPIVEAKPQPPARVKGRIPGRRGPAQTYDDNDYNDEDDYLYDEDDELSGDHLVSYHGMEHHQQHGDDNANNGGDLNDSEQSNNPAGPRRSTRARQVTNPNPRLPTHYFDEEDVNHLSRTSNMPNLEKKIPASYESLFTRIFKNPEDAYQALNHAAYKEQSHFTIRRSGKGTINYTCPFGGEYRRPRNSSRRDFGTSKKCNCPVKINLNQSIRAHGWKFSRQSFISTHNHNPDISSLSLRRFCIPRSKWHIIEEHFESGMSPTEVLEYLKTNPLIPQDGEPDMVVTLRDLVAFRKKVRSRQPNRSTEAMYRPFSARLQEKRLQEAGTLAYGSNGVGGTSIITSSNNSTDAIITRDSVRDNPDNTTSSSSSSAASSTSSSTSSLGSTSSDRFVKLPQPRQISPLPQHYAQQHQHLHNQQQQLMMQPAISQQQQPVYNPSYQPPQSVLPNHVYPQSNTSNMLTPSLLLPQSSGTRPHPMIPSQQQHHQQLNTPTSTNTNTRLSHALSSSSSSSMQLSNPNTIIGMNTNSGNIPMITSNNPATTTPNSNTLRNLSSTLGLVDTTQRRGSSTGLLSQIQPPQSSSQQSSSQQSSSQHALSFLSPYNPHQPGNNNNNNNTSSLLSLTAQQPPPNPQTYALAGLPQQNSFKYNTPTNTNTNNNTTVGLLSSLTVPSSSSSSSVTSVGIPSGSSNSLSQLQHPMLLASRTMANLPVSASGPLALPTFSPHPSGVGIPQNASLSKHH